MTKIIKKNVDTVIEIIEKYPDKDGTGILKILLEIFNIY